ncbi:uncharacterized protein LOC109791855 [Cajanus cajan]|uniref:uncharacterized protein LOC109791855 n=1 Tax=Cajanus cajan TaxID=3821 RepID=UPI00098DB0A3|nr:uncharacterized protein LOC109791855 [Cajanus cajan]XP_020206795.1 uncharacterized protein LOC109791855 [Cajanus cajan]
MNPMEAAHGAPIPPPSPLRAPIMSPIEQHLTARMDHVQDLFVVIRRALESLNDSFYRFTLHQHQQDPNPFQWPTPEAFSALCAWPESRPNFPAEWRLTDHMGHMEDFFASIRWAFESLNDYFYRFTLHQHQQDPNPLNWPTPEAFSALCAWPKGITIFPEEEEHVEVGAGVEAEGGEQEEEAVAGGAEEGSEEEVSSDEEYGSQAESMEEDEGGQ